MAINFPKWLAVLATILALLLLMPVTTSAATFGFHTPSQAIYASAASLVTTYPSFSDLDLTPLQRQRLQSVLQRRNKEIQAVLDISQRDTLRHQIHSGHSFNQALLSLELQPEQQHLIKAIEQLTSLKLKALLVKYSVPSVSN
ncbi:hypothetical protein ACN23B_20455 [Anabaena sp. FACHB-709]|jgi:hypothetical protein|uniref:Periplasmic heavy metal sensor n=2 Tax=Nostocaceae TaxID=1162 RepID=A0A1Z4KL57_ANAVA|nr:MULTISPECIES: hypothetical protein [Nostocaceae]BAY69699.1 hypothetical protein NIES23_24940 [Trichormus variabilis NIES-23]HBW32433.1 hypothetical protein [Nostoc sp. UBA8866]MBD2173647.1 hypothetical protein [Anabaena cylindrica FACHB-318]MBD2265474.1 hypothetical protein [Anabaena sp. FACHB-709]MBD2274602.1 hypothetical protein [Nostoc sp. PCC 7120 = FACHB-418]